MTRVKQILGLMIFLGLTGCAYFSNPLDRGRGFKGSSYFERPPSQILFSDKEIFNQALSLQYKGQLSLAIGLWKKFLVDHSGAFEALNNLGMAYYSNDELDQAIESFEIAAELEPGSERIKRNLRRALRFRVTLNKENREYHVAIKDLEKMSGLGSENKKETILREIEDLQEKIFSAIQQLDKMEDYQNFVENYPNGFYADKARDKIRALAPTTEDSSKPKEFLPPLTPATPQKGRFPGLKSALDDETERVMPENLIQESETAVSRTPSIEEAPLSSLVDELVEPAVEESDKRMALGLTMIGESGMLGGRGPEGKLAFEEPAVLAIESEIRKVRITTKFSLLNINTTNTTIIKQHNPTSHISCNFKPFIIYIYNIIIWEKIN